MVKYFYVQLVFTGLIRDYAYPYVYLLEFRVRGLS